MKDALKNNFNLASAYIGGSLAIAAPVAALITLALSDIFYMEDDPVGLTSGEMLTFGSLTALGLTMAISGYNRVFTKDKSDALTRSKPSHLFNLTASVTGAGLSSILGLDVLMAIIDGTDSPSFASYSTAAMGIPAGLGLFMAGHSRLCGKTNTAFGFKKASAQIMPTTSP